MRLAFAAAVGTIGLSACDATTPQNASVSPPAQPGAIGAGEAIAAGETLTDVVRAALADVVRDPDAFSRARRLGALLPTLGPELVPAAVETLGNPTLDLGATEVELLVRFWATHQGEEASRWAVEKSPPGFRSAAIFASLARWAETDPWAAASAAQRWSRRPDVREAVQIALVEGWFAANPDELAQFIHDMGMGFFQQRALLTYLRAMIKTQGIDAAVRWAEAVPDDDAAYRTAVYRQVIAVLALFDHEAAVRWCDAHCDGPHGKHLRNLLGMQWAVRDGAAALAWLSSAPEGHAKDLAVRSAFGEWGRADREAALGWMEAQTTGELDPWLRPIIPVYAQLLAQDSPAEGIKWAERIESDDDREILLVRFARAWRQIDEAAAETWLLQSSLSEEAREKVRSAEDQRRPGQRQPIHQRQPNG